MKVSCFLVCLALAFGVRAGQAQETREPLLTFYELKANASEMTSGSFDPRKPLLTIFSVSDQQLARDDKGVLLHFTPEDTKAFSVLTSQFSGRYLLVVGKGDTEEALHITAPIEDGYIGFRYPEEAKMAAYLKSKLFPK